MKSGDRAVILLIIVAASMAFYLARLAGTSEEVYAEIRVGNVVREVIDLSAVSEPYTKTFRTGNGGYNVVEVRRGMIRVVEANCPEQIDVRQGWISRPYQSIVCLPHRFVITLYSQRHDGLDVDGVSY